MFIKRGVASWFGDLAMGSSAPAERSGLRTSLRSMSYAEGAEALAPGGTLDTTIARAEEASADNAAAQMARIVSFAEANNAGSSSGRCFEYVWRYIYQSGYGKIRNFGDCPEMGSAEARMFAEYMNSGNNAADWGLQRLGGSTPYAAPAGAIVVVGPGSPGTRHATAGDIAVARGDGTFINDGPQMRYGPPERFLSDGGSLLGIYAPL